MDSQGQFVATLTEASARALAAGAITRLSESGDTDVEAWGFPALVADAQARLGCLTEALAAGCPDLLRLEVDWLATTPRNAKTMVAINVSGAFVPAR